MAKQTKQRKYLRRKKRVNMKVKASNFTYRLVVNKTNKYMYVHLLDRDGKAFVMLNDKGMKGDTKVDRAFALGQKLAQEAAKQKIQQVTFDRNGFRYHGRVKAVCEWAKKEGLKI